MRVLLEYVESCIMDTQKAMKIVYEEIKRAKDLSAKDTDIMISPKNFKGKLSATDLWRTLHKMSKDYNLLTLVLSPDAITAHHYDDVHEINQRNYEAKNKYIIHVHDNFDDFPLQVLKETIPESNLPDYLPFYIQIMLQAIDELKIKDDNQPAKKEIVGWFNDNYPDLSGNDVRALSTFVRHPDKKQGGWHSNSKKTQKK